MYAFCTSCACYVPNSDFSYPGPLWTAHTKNVPVGLFSSHPVVELWPSKYMINKKTYLVCCTRKFHQFDSCTKKFHQFDTEDWSIEKILFNLAHPRHKHSQLQKKKSSLWRWVHWMKNRQVPSRLGLAQAWVDPGPIPVRTRSKS